MKIYLMSVTDNERLNGFKMQARTLSLVTWGMTAPLREKGILDMMGSR